MRIVELMEASGSVYYHGTNASFDWWVLKADKVNRSQNVEGIYFTPSEGEAKSYGSRVVAARLTYRKPFYSNRRNIITQPMAKVYAEFLSSHTHHPQYWIDEVLVPNFIEKGRVSFMDIRGGVKRDILLAGGYDAYIDGEHVVILEPSRRNIEVIA